MRRSSDLPRRRRVSGRVVLIAIVAIVLFVLIFGRALAGFYINYLWHSSLDRSDVFWGRITAQLTLFGAFTALFALLAGVNLFIADRLAPSSFPANVHPYVERFHELFGKRLRLLRYGVAVLLAILFALPTTSQWQNWLMFRNSTSFGESDPQFGADVGFYMFELPFLSFLLDWVFVAVLVVLLLTLVAHVLNGGVVFASPIPAVRNATKAHLAVLLALLAALRAAIYWLSRYDMTNERRGFVQGATYAVVNAQLPAVMLLLLIAVLTAALFLVSIRTGSWRLPLMASALWVVVALVGSLIYPAMIQALVVNPNQEGREADYIERNMDATRAAYGLGEDDVRVEDASFSDLTAADLVENIDALRDVRLLNPQQFRSRFELDYGNEAGFTINDLDVDRYVLEDRPEQVLMAARELHPEGIPNRSWQGQHLIYTRGCGLVVAPTSVVGADDNPVSQEVGGSNSDIDLDNPELYFSPDLGGYAVVNTSQGERSCDDVAADDDDADDQEGDIERDRYTGEHGVEISSFFRRSAFALSFLDYNILGSGAITSDSQVLWRRGVRDRAESLAPFLEYDGDPYPVAVDGRVLWIIDAYTTSSRYPYSQRIGDVQLTEQTGLDPSDNYVRNSVKVTVDAYDGSVTYYRMDDPEDPEPVLETWSKVFPDLLTPSDEVPDDLREHFRYPEDLFRVQTDLYSKYFLPTASDFFSRSNAWSVAQAPSVSPSDVANGTATQAQAQADSAEAAVSEDFATESGSERFLPYYTYFHDPATGDEEFVLFRPFVPFSRDDRRTELTAYMTASSDPETYGELTVYNLNQTEPGPLQVMRDMEASQDIGEAITLLSRGNRQVRFGDFQILPVGEGLLYVRPFYVLVATSNDEVPTATEYRFVMVNYNGESAFGTSLRDALDDPDLFPNFDTEVGDRPIGAVEDVEEIDLEEGEGGGTADGTEGDGDTGDEEPPDTTTEPTDTTETPETTEPSDTDPTDTTTPSSPSASGDDATPTELLDAADQLYAEAEDDLRNGDLGAYQEKVDEASDYVSRALELLNEEEGGGG